MPFENEDLPERAFLVSVDTGEYDAELLLDELRRLAQSAGAEVCGSAVQKREKPDGAAFVGSGMLTDITEFCKTNEIDLLIFDGELSPTQQRNIEKETGVRTIDRSLLILDIFASRAHSSEGRIQVSLARLQYMLPRLSGQGKSLSRQGGIGMRRGAGESKLESDRRHIRSRIYALKRQLAEIEKRRGSQRAHRQKAGIPTAAIVGYTNAGKSTLLNALTGAGVLAEDRLFATLDPTARALTLPDGRMVMLVDTVGLIRRLPHHLVEAFHSTLEEACDADVILNLCDASDPEAAEQLAVTEKLLSELECDPDRILRVYNKCDRLDAEQLSALPAGSLCISAAGGRGLDSLLVAVEKKLTSTRRHVRLLLPFSEGGISAVLRKSGMVHSEEYTENGLLIDCTAEDAVLERYKSYLL